MNIEEEVERWMTKAHSNASRNADTIVMLPQYAKEDRRRVFEATAQRAKALGWSAAFNDDRLTITRN